MRDDELEDLLIAEAPLLLGLARRLAPSGIDAADLVQDAAERAWAARAQITDRAQAPAWLRRILVNRLRDLARRRALIAFSALETVGDPPDITPFRTHSRSCGPRNATGRYAPRCARCPATS